LEGPNTQLGAGGLAIDTVNNLLIIAGNAPEPGRTGEEPGGGAGAGGSSNALGQVTIFNRTDSGNVKPRAIIRGPKTHILHSARVAVYPPTKYFLIGVNSDTGEPSPDNCVGVWSENDNGDVPPRWTIGGPNQMLRQVRGVTLVPKAKSVVISDKYLNSVMTFE